MQQKEVGSMDALTNIIRCKSYHIMNIKETDYAMLVMTTYRTLNNLEVLDMQRRYKGLGGEVATKWFNYHELFGNHFHYQFQVDDNNNPHHSPIYMQGTWEKNIGLTVYMLTS